MNELETLLMQLAERRATVTLRPNVERGLLTVKVETLQHSHFLNTPFEVIQDKGLSRVLREAARGAQVPDFY